MSIATLDNGAPGSVEHRQALPQGNPARYTGQVLFHTRPRTYRKVVELLAQGQSVSSIIRQCHVSEHSVNAIRQREMTAIEDRKRELVSMLTDVAHLATGRVADTVAKASCRDAAVVTGISIDKTLALLGQSPAVQIANVIMPSEADREERRQLHDKLDDISRRLASAPASTPSVQP